MVTIIAIKRMSKIGIVIPKSNELAAEFSAFNLLSNSCKFYRASYKNSELTEVSSSKTI